MKFIPRNQVNQQFTSSRELLNGTFSDSPEDIMSLNSEIIRFWPRETFPTTTQDRKNKK